MLPCWRARCCCSTSCCCWRSRRLPICDADSEGAIEYAFVVRCPSSSTVSGSGGYTVPVRCDRCVARDLTDCGCDAAVRGDQGRSGGGAPAHTFGSIPMRPINVSIKRDVEAHGDGRSESDVALDQK